MGELVEKVEKPDSFSLDSESYGLTATLSRMGVEPELLDLSEFETYEPLGILVELAQHGKIDPWDIDIVELTDGFLRRVEELKKMDLRISSRTLLYSAILLRMKSSCVLEENAGEEELEEDSGFFEEEDFPEPAEFPIPKLPVRRLSTRPVTLNELILELKKAEKSLSRKNEKKARQVLEERAFSENTVFSTGDALGIAHDEAISSRLTFLWGKLSKVFETCSCAAFSELMKGSEDQIMDYLSLLFLASNRKVWLCQKELFEELYIYPGNESGFSTEGNPPGFREVELGSESEAHEPGEKEENFIEDVRAYE
jgi:segregation and condensation protein A